MTRPGWEGYALLLAEAASRRSEDPFFAVGAVVLRMDNSVAAVGYNGAPPGVELDWADRDTRRAYVIHAEVNALRYVTKLDTVGGLLAVTHCPCQTCLLLIASYGIGDVVYRHDLDWSVYDQSVIRDVAEVCGVSLEKE